ncbi:MAG: peptidylprolyl isomerase [Bacteroidota bacterium]
MKNKLIKQVVIAAVFIFSGNLFAQSGDPVLLTIAGEPVTKSEFLSVYKKNNLKNGTVDQKSLEEYLDLFTNFKLKVTEAKKLGYDTLVSFRDELAGYRKQLTQPYFFDKDVNDKLLKEAYDRNTEVVRASHILIKCDPDASPQDTLAAYNKLISIRDRIHKGEDFGKLAKEFSDDPSSKDQPAMKDRPARKGNGGDLGYFTSLQMVYPFETAAFNTKVGSISMPVRTRYGYHIVKVADRKANVGMIQVAHILVRTPPGQSAADSLKTKEKVDDLYKQIQNGADFSELANKYSDDKGTVGKGGVLPYFSTGRMVPEFESAAFALKNNGDVSAPIKTDYGWHIIKRVELKKLQSFDEMKADLKVKVAKDGRSELPKKAVIAKLKKEDKFKDKKVKKKVQAFYAVVDTSFFKNQWKVESAAKLNEKMFTIGKEIYTQQDFAKFLAANQLNKAKAGSVETTVNQLYDRYVEESILKYEDVRMDVKYPEFKALMKEYHEGILLFEITDDKVWSKAVKDTIGLLDFYSQNKNNYKWNDRVDATIYQCATPEIAEKVKTMLGQGSRDAEILEKVNKDSQLNLKIDNGRYSKGDNKYVDMVTWKEGIADAVKENTSFVMVNIHKVLAPEAKSFNDSKGLVTADYQNFLEKRWVDELRKKYPVVVNKDVLQSIK